MTAQAEAQDLVHPDRKTIQSLFNAISPKYDFLNSFLSFGLHHYWRRKTVRLSLTGLEQSILDVGAGTGKSLAAFLHHHQFQQAVGCDFSESMLAKAKERLGPRAFLVAGDFQELPFPDGAFDLVTGSFILRSVQNMPYFLSEVKRVLSPQGKAVFLELTRPTNQFIWRYFYRPYLKFCIPSVGRILSKHDHAYQFLSQSVQAFVEPESLRNEFFLAGFNSVSVRPLTFGTATLFEGKRAGSA